ncbi:hypothetical protein GALL_549050 [mine drainage metagenome]|uniref:ATPase P n=1 Tax=mine drainage metagenome TaxID=410659 RepID=A0A1J5NWF7_9ZZZZ
MLRLDIPGFAALALEHLVLDFNGTLALDGRLREGVAPRLQVLAGVLAIHVVTGDTHSTARNQLQGLPVALTVLGPDRQAEAKREHLQRLGRKGCAAIGNGRNDRLMLGEAALGIAVTGPEGTSPEALHAAHLFVPDILEALDLLAHPLRLVASLRG